MELPDSTDKKDVYAWRSDLGSWRLAGSKVVSTEFNPIDEVNSTDDLVESAEEAVDHDKTEIDDDYEEICSDEVDRVVEALETLGESVQSQNIKVCLDEASDKVFYLIYDSEDEESDSTDAEAA